MNKKLMRGVCTLALLSSAAFALASCGSDAKTTATAQNSNTTTTANTPADDPFSYHLLWKDEFDGDKLDTTIWNRQVRPRGWTNQELQEYVTDEENGFIRDGKFVIKAIEQKNEDGTPMVDNAGNAIYKSCKLDTQNKQDFMYGKVEVSAKVPTGKGLWPAIWMMPTDESYYGQWPKCGEIDIMEVLGHETNKTYGTIHYGEPHAEQQGSLTLPEGKTFADEFHKYTVEWDAAWLRWYVDDQEILYVRDWFSAEAGQDDKPFPAPFNQTFFLQINLAVGGTWPGNPVPGADYMDNAEFEIDYVRVYQKGSYPTNVQKPKPEFREPDATGNYITNCDFSNAGENLLDGTGWDFLKANGGQGKATIENGEVVISSTANGDVDYGIQLLHYDIPMFKDQKYKISFDIWADGPRTINEICIDAPNCGWQRYWAVKNYEVPQELTHFEETFVMTEKTDNSTRFEFNMGNTDSTANIHITNVRVEKVDE